MYLLWNRCGSDSQPRFFHISYIYMNGTQNRDTWWDLVKFVMRLWVCMMQKFDYLRNYQLLKEGKKNSAP